MGCWAYNAFALAQQRFSASKQSASAAKRHPKPKEGSYPDPITGFTRALAPCAGSVEGLAPQQKNFNIVIKLAFGGLLKELVEFVVNAVALLAANHTLAIGKELKIAHPIGRNGVHIV